MLRRLALATCCGLLVAGTAVLGAPDPLPGPAQARLAGRPVPGPAPVPRERPVAPEPEPVPDPAPRTATVVMGGDLLWHNTVWLSAAEEHARTGRGRGFDFDPMFASLRPMIRSADVAICHEEVPFAAPGAPYLGYPVFAAPPMIASWIAHTGWDACVTASNHSLDQGYDGLLRTADLLDAAGVAHVGTFRSRAERRDPVIVTTEQGVEVAIVAGTYGTNGFPLPEGREWAVSLWDADNLLAQAHRARRAGADIVVVHLHGGTEYDPLPNADQVALVRRLTASPDVDLVLGEHAHVVQPITRVHGTWVVYGLGNMVAQSEVTRPRAYEGITVEFTFTERADGGFRVSDAAYVPTTWNTWSPGVPIRIRRVRQALAHGYGDTTRLREALREVRAAVHGLGPVPGLHER